jgi:lipopolysaccharide/colanic/teichoic acid biosynthesis glycosyltransferase
MAIKLVIKRIFDILISLIAIVILFPLLIIIAILIYFKLGSPIFFIQKRPGKHGKIFKMIKFRSMSNKKDENEVLLSDDKRLTAFGRGLRGTSIDELPELINVIKGEMSLVGPRPLLVEYLEFYNEEQKKRHNVLPGITGWAQINGRNSISWAEKFKLDVWYVENWSLWLDVKIIFKTFIKVFERDGINQSESMTMEWFNGSD